MICPECESTDVQGYWLVQVSGGVDEAGNLNAAGLDTEMREIVGQARDTGPVSFMCLDCATAWDNERPS